MATVVGRTTTSFSRTTLSRQEQLPPCVARRRPAPVETLPGVSRARRLVSRLPAKNGGSGVLENPTISKPTYDKSTDSVRKKPPIYKVMLHNDTYNRREYVVKVLLKVIDGLTVDDAVNVMQEAHEQGLALVVACAQDQAEQYCEGLRLNGLIASLEPGQ